MSINIAINGRAATNKRIAGLKEVNKKTIESLESGLARLANPFNKIIHKRRQNSIKGSKKNILAHYDLSNDFYQLWLDSTMTYSCGVFLNDDSSMKAVSYTHLTLPTILLV